MTVSQAEKELFAALAAGRIVAVAKDAAGNVVEIPDREWPYLQRFEEHERDVLKRDALDREATFSEIIFRREDLKGLWEELLIQPYMIEPMMRAGTAGYVPLCSAVHWIMTEAGQKVQHLEDSQLWKASVDRLLPLISTGEVQIIGTAPGGTPETIEGHIFAGILVSEPMQVSFEMITGDSPWISCTSYIDEEHWKNGFNDELYLHGSATASWTHLQVKKANVLREFSALMDKSIPAAKSSDPMPKMRTDIREIARQLWPDGKTPPRVKERDEAIRAKFKNPPSERTIRRALKDWP
jgi:hypothetical protein